MATTGDVLTLPGGVSFELVASAADSGGERVEFVITLPPGAPGPPRHFHPRQEERWEVLEGTLDVELSGRRRRLASGESVSIPAGSSHTLRNRSGAVVRVRDVHMPALGFEDYVEALHRVATEHGGLSLRRPASIVRLAMVWHGHRDTQVTTSPAQRLAETALAALGRALGYRVP